MLLGSFSVHGSSPNFSTTTPPQKLLQPRGFCSLPPASLSYITLPFCPRTFSALLVHFSLLVLLISWLILFSLSSWPFSLSSLKAVLSLDFSSCRWLTLPHSSIKVFSSTIPWRSNCPCFHWHRQTVLGREVSEQILEVEKPHEARTYTIFRWGNESHDI